MVGLRKIILEAAHHAGEGHVPSALSVLDILWVLYDKILNIDPKNPNHPSRDRFILSKGHASLGLYAVLGTKEFFPLSEIREFGKYNSRLGGHPDTTKVPGAEASTGSLGHGFPMSVGVALALKIQKSSSKVFTLIGDGESNEGSIWEAALLAAHHRLNNLICIVDYNHSTDRALSVGKLEKKFEAFDWETRSINGHNQADIFKALSTPSERPVAVIAETIKGYGIKSMENNPEWHHRSPKKEELRSFLEEIRAV
ncbi:MAG: Transketolase [Bacteriovoracaceae bacterium]|nr:Transketolase [Bacteriovoracaceae bacterium]